MKHTNDSTMKEYLQKENEFTVMAVRGFENWDIGSK